MQKNNNKNHKKDIKLLALEIIPNCGLPKSLQNDNMSSFKAAVTYGVPQAVSILHHCHCAWRPQSSVKAEKLNETLRRHHHKMAQKTYVQ